MKFSEELEEIIFEHFEKDKMPISNIAKLVGVSPYKIRVVLCKRGHCKDPAKDQRGRRKNYVHMTPKPKAKIYDCKCPACGEMYKRAIDNWIGTGTPRIRHDKCPLPQAAGIYNGAGRNTTSSTYLV